MSKKSLLDSINVMSPCTESWDEMQGNDKFRFCSHCAKDVNNISEMTRKETMRLVRRSGGNLCVRYIKNPVTNRPVFVQNLYKITRRVPGLAAGVMTASIALSSAAYAQTDGSADPAIQIVDELKTEASGSGISGYVTDQNGALLPYALVTLLNADGYVIQAVNASAEGFYEFKDLGPGNYSLKIEAGGFTSATLTSITVTGGSQVRRDAQLAVQNVEEVVQVGGEEGKEESTVLGGAISCTITTGPINRLVEAVYDEDLDEVTRLIAKGKRVNSKDANHDGVTALHAAVEVGNIEIAQLLLNSGANINGRDSLKRTPLMMLDDDATPELLQLLLRYGAKINLTDKKGATALAHFAEYDEPDMVRLFVSAGANANAVNKAGETALMAAAAAGNVEVVKALLESGASANPRSKSGETAWDTASNPEIRSLLESYGAIARNN